MPLHRDVLQRPPDPAGAQAWAQAVAGGMPRSVVAAAFLGSVEADRLEAKGLYRQFLHHDADSTGLDAFASALQRVVPNEIVVGVVVSSDECFARV
jgi:hypothetical protein